MELYTKQEVLDFWDANATEEYRNEKREIEELQKDIDTARKYIRDALARYRKAKTKSRSKAKGSDPFVDLQEYNTFEELHEAFGWGFISEAEFHRLWDLWNLREATKDKEKKVLEDRVTEMLERAIRVVSDPYDDRLLGWQQKTKERSAAAKEVADANFRRSSL